VISAHTEQILHELRGLEQHQQPSEHMRQMLRDITLVGIVAPSASGKNMLIDTMLDTHKSWHYVPSVTTRPKQERDTPGSYRAYIPHDDSGIAAIYNDVVSGRLLQFAMHPLTNHIMATYLADYSGAVNLKDLYASSVDSFRKLGFGRLVVVSLVTPYDLWKPRFDARFPVNDTDRAKRLAEAASSTNWSQKQANATDHLYLVNDGTPVQASEKMTAIIEQQATIDPHAQKMAQEFEAALRAEENL
jgi:ribose 1,5-bisphosphokinase PhnN